MQAVIASGGKQYIVQAGDIVNLELLRDQDKFEFQALMTFNGDAVKVGAPFVDGVTVAGELVAEIKGEKIKVLRFKAKKRVKRLTGHRQKYTQIKILSIG